MFFEADSRSSASRGLIHSRLHQQDEAVSSFTASIVAYPSNWSAYLALLGLVASLAELEVLLPMLPQSHPFTACFEIHARLDLHANADRACELIQQLERDVFSMGLSEKGRQEGKSWVWGESMRAMASYHLRGASKPINHTQ